MTNNPGQVEYILGEALVYPQMVSIKHGVSICGVREQQYTTSQLIAINCSGRGVDDALIRGIIILIDSQERIYIIGEKSSIVSTSMSHGPMS